MSIQIPIHLFEQIHKHGEQAYPEEGAGLMLGEDHNGDRHVTTLFFLDNAREQSARHNRYLITAEVMLKGEKEAERLGLTILGIFHSHPDHPNQPSEFDREFAMPWYSYLITSISKGLAVDSQCWRLADDRSTFLSEEILK
ncbi:MAG: M67 family metallopeptidase [Anaerolineales bacterium]|nr:M67 family metallopeptidase [Anaerolineales bacterium]